MTRIMPRPSRTLASAAFLIAVCAVAGWCLSWFRPPLLERLDMAVFDRFRAAARPPPVSEKIVVVLATEASMREIRQWPWPRSIHAELIGKLGLARHVVLDILFPEPSTPDEDALLAAVVAEHGRVTAAIHFVPSEEGGEDRLLLPYPALARAAAGFGIANISPEPDGIYRDAYLFWRYREDLIPSLPFAGWLAVNETPPPVEETASGGFRVDFPFGPLATGSDSGFKVHHPAVEILKYEYADVYHGRVPQEIFTSALVFIGASMVGASDHLAVGGGRDPLPGVVYNAHATATLFHGWIPVPVSDRIVGLAGLLLAAGGAFIGLKSRGRRSWLWFLLLALAWSGIAAGLFFLYRLWMPPVTPFLGGLGAYFLTTVVQLRYLSDEWRVQRLSIHSLLFLNRQDFDPAKVAFSDYLRNRWTDIEKWSGITLLLPAGGEDDPAVRDCLERAADRGADRDADAEYAQATVINARGRGNGRLLLGLPRWAENEERLYAVMGWRGRKSPEMIKSVAALTLAAYAHYKAYEETQAKKELFLGVIRMIMGAIDAKDPTTAGHSERVAVLGRTLAEKLGVSPREVEEVYLGGLLHDVGKIGIPEHILNKPGRLTDDEMAVMRRHPGLGAELMRQIKLPDIVIQGIVEHHERPDGRGYPHGVAGDALSRAGQILKVADVYDALSSKRQYKEPMSADVVYRILTEGSGSDFDSDIIALLLANPFTDSAVQVPERRPE